MRQCHLRVGLDKLRDTITDTVTQVEQLRKGLAVKPVQLETKDKEANERLWLLVSKRPSKRKLLPGPSKSRRVGYEFSERKPSAAPSNLDTEYTFTRVYRLSRDASIWHG